LKSANATLRRAVVKLNEGFSGSANAVFQYPKNPGPAAIRNSLASLSFSEPEETPESYFGRLPEMGGIVEEMIEGGEIASARRIWSTSPRPTICTTTMDARRESCSI
jgi:hypothetical protein